MDTAQQENTMSHHTTPSKRLLTHTVLVGVLGGIVGATLLVFAPTIPFIAQSITLFAAFHILGAFILLVSLYSLTFKKTLRAWRARHQSAPASGYDFGWEPEWMNGLALTAIVLLFIAAIIMSNAVNWWPLSLILILLAATCFVGNIIMQSIRHKDFVVLPMVKLLTGSQSLVLDAGCGTGRTSIALSRVLGEGKLVAFDRFDADYIQDGGRELLTKNLTFAGLSERTTIQRGDLPFENDTFDGAVSAHVFDHLGSKKKRALQEIFRTLKPNSRFLMIVWVPGWSMFAIGNILSFLLTSRQSWRQLAQSVGFHVVDEGQFNSAWFVVLEKPAPSINSNSRYVP